MTAPDPRLDAIKDRLGAATPGPWAHYGNLGHEVFASTGVEDEEPGIAFDIPRLADATFIANAPADVAYLLSVVESQAGQIAKVRELAEAFDAKAGHRWAATQLRAALAPEGPEA